jgi:thioredoxin reductase (NADPH)
VEKDELGFIKTDQKFETNIPGLFAVGDLRSKGVRQIATAV